MKKIYPIVLAGLMLVLASCHKDILNRLDSVEERVANLEILCAQMNTNIDALQTIVNALQTNDMITNVSEIKEGNNVTGYTITFLSGKSITIHNGKDGADGKNGQDGETPVVSVKQDTDGVYYWTVNGSWLLDEDGNKLPVTGAKGDKGDTGDKGEDGVDGTNGTNGTNGTDGTNGTNGVTPQLKIENDYWYVSYDNGANWTELGKATGENGKDGTNGTDGAKGDKGDSMFSSVSQDDNNVYFTLADGTTVITVSKYVEKDYYTLTYDANGGTGTMEAEQISVLKNPIAKSCTFTYAAHSFTEWNTKADGSGVSFAAGETIAMKGDLTLYAQWHEMSFSVSANKKVLFAPGNLQYQASTNTWRFAENQYDYIGGDNNKISSTYTGWIDLFGWGTANNPTNMSTNSSDYSTFTDWGTNEIDGDAANTWRTLTNDEWVYVFTTRTNASSLYGLATVNGTKGLILLPDSWALPSGLTFNSGTATYTNNVYTTAQWQQMESNGAVFLPAAGNRDGTLMFSVQSYGYYWSSTVYDSGYSNYLSFTDGRLNPQDFASPLCGLSVRLVQD